MRLLCLAALGLALAACQGKVQPQGDDSAPLETRAPNAPDQKPAFPGQTRAPGVKSDVAYRIVEVASGLGHPWGLAFLPDGRLLVTERDGRLRILRPDGKLSAPVAGLPKIEVRGQGGLLGVAVDPAFTETGVIYFAFAEADTPGGPNGTSAARGKLVEAGGAPRLEAVKVIFRQSPRLDSLQHFGGRVVVAPDGKLFITTGERSILPGRMQAQRLDGLLGKVSRIETDGSIPADNPFAGQAGKRGEIWSYGHRNPLGAAINPATGELWTVEHGARGGDELNIPRKGRDYGWPTITYGEEYSGEPIGAGLTQKEGMEQPVYYWDPVIAPSGMMFYSGKAFPSWKGNLFIGGLGTMQVVRLTLDGDRVSGEEHLFTEVRKRIRDVVEGPDGAIYLATDEAAGRILKVTPK